MFKFAEAVRSINIDVKEVQGTERDTDQRMLFMIIKDNCEFYSDRVRVPSRVKIHRIPCTSCGEMIPADLACGDWGVEASYCKACYCKLKGFSVSAF